MNSAEKFHPHDFFAVFLNYQFLALSLDNVHSRLNEKEQCWRSTNVCNAHLLGADLFAVYLLRLSIVGCSAPPPPPGPLVDYVRLKKWRFGQFTNELFEICSTLSVIILVVFFVLDELILKCYVNIIILPLQCALVKGAFFVSQTTFYYYMKIYS